MSDQQNLQLLTPGPEVDKLVADAVPGWTGAPSTDWRNAMDLLMHIFENKCNDSVRIQVTMQPGSFSVDLVALTGHGRICLAAHDSLAMAVCLAILKSKERGWFS